jgi:hypothetical protein
VERWLGWVSPPHSSLRVHGGLGMSDLIINVLDLRAVGWATHGFAGAPLSSGRPTQPRAEFGPSSSIQLNGTLSIQESYENSPWAFRFPGG